MLFNSITHPAYNVILAKTDDEILWKIFWDATRRFNYDLRVTINENKPNVLFVDYYKDSLVILTDEEDETMSDDITIEFWLDLTWKVGGFNRLENERMFEINQIHEIWEQNENKEYVLKETNFDDVVRKEVFKLKLHNEALDPPKLPDRNKEHVEKIIDAEFVEINDKQIEMNGA